MNKSTVRLVADGCGVQNKNTTMIGMYWLLNEAPQNIKALEIIFPVSGHSYILPDRTDRKAGKLYLLFNKLIM